MATRVLIHSFAKVNLFLDVICKRDDGYHNIETVFQRVSLSDSIEVELTPSAVAVTCNNPAVPADESNLACKAFLKLKGVLSYKGGVRISLKKNIPVGSGLGGGSSNAAATLVALNRLLQGGLSERELSRIAREVGADVAFFISGGLAAAWQIGDRIKPLRPFPPSFLVLAVPNDVSVSTSAAYSLIAADPCGGVMPERFSDCSDRLKRCVNALERSTPLFVNGELPAILHNSFETPVFARYPGIAELRSLLLESGAKAALMSGSGSAVFGIASSYEDAERIQKRVAKHGIHWSVVVHTIDRGSEFGYPP